MTVRIEVVPVNEAPNIRLSTVEGGLGDPIPRVTEGQEFVVTTPEQDPLDLDSQGPTHR